MVEMEKAERDYEFLRQCFCEVLREIDEGDVAAVVAAAGESGATIHSQAAAQAQSIAFTLLNLAEENAARSTSRRPKRRKGSQRSPADRDARFNS